MDIATLGLRIINEAAVRALDVTSAKLDEMGQKGEQNAAKLTASSQKTTNELGRQQQQVQNLGRQYTQLSSGEISGAAAWFDNLYGKQAKVTESTVKMAAATERSGNSIRLLRSPMASLASQALGTSSALGTAASALLQLEAGAGVAVAVAASVAVIGYAWNKLGGDADTLAKRVDDAMKKVKGSIMDAQLAMGDLQIAQAVKDVAKAQADLTAASHVKYDAKTGLASGTEGDVGAARKALDDANRALFEFRQQKSQIDSQITFDSQRSYAENLALLVSSNHATASERARALALYQSDLAEINRLGKSQTDNVRRAALIGDTQSLGGALFPKARKEGGSSKPAFLDTVTMGSAAVQQSVEASIKWYDKEVQAADKAIAARAKFVGGESLTAVPKELLANGSPALKAFDAATDLAKVTQARIDAENVNRASHGQGPIYEGPGSVMDKYRKSAIDAGEVVKNQLQQMGLSGKALHDILELINKDYKDIGANAPKTQSSRAVDIANQTASYARSAADAVNLFGSGPKAQQAGNLLNTGANAIDDFTHGNIAQGTLALASFGKQIVGFGGQSHDAARALAEASESIKTMIATLNASVNHDALGGALAAAQAADDARRSQINSSLSGTKHEKERNAALAQDAADYAIVQQQVKDKVALAQQDFTDSTKASTARAKGQTYTADMIDLQVQQRDTMQTLVDQGLVMLNGSGTAQQRANYIAEQNLFAAQRTALATESLTQLANSPSGFFAERYFGQYSTPASFPGAPAAAPTTYGSFSNAPTITPPTTSGTTRGTISLAGVTLNFPLPATTDPKALATEVVKGLRQFADQYGGMGSSASETMDLIPA